MSKIVITRKDVIWGYVAQACNIGANILVLPAIFKFLPSSTLGVWYVFVNLGMFSTLIGIVFQNSFSRNIAYAFGGATSLLEDGVDENAQVLPDANYPFIKSLLYAMQRFYVYVSLGMGVLLISAGSLYIYYLTRDFPDQSVVLYSWVLYVASIVFGFYCINFYCILQGRGYIKEHNQLMIINRTIYLLLAYIFLFSGYGILGVVAANCISGVVNFLTGRLMAYKDGLRHILKNVEISSVNMMLVVWRNTYRQGIANLAMYISTKGSLFYASLFIPLATIAKYGLSLQVINVLTTIALLYFSSYLPYVAQSWITHNYTNIRRIYTKSLVLMLILYISGCTAVFLFGNWGLRLIGSGTTLLPAEPLLLLFVVYLLDSNQALAINLISSSNKVPYMPAAIVSAVAIFILMPVLIIVFDLGVSGAILAIGLVQLCYQNWKWVADVSKRLRLNYIQQIQLGVQCWLTKDRVRR